jgi:hypothetical protein
LAARQRAGRIREWQRARQASNARSKEGRAWARSGEPAPSSRGQWSWTGHASGRRGTFVAAPRQTALPHQEKASAVRYGAIRLGTGAGQLARPRAVRPARHCTSSCTAMPVPRSEPVPERTTAGRGRPYGFGILEISMSLASISSTSTGSGCGCGCGANCGACWPCGVLKAVTLRCVSVGGNGQPHLPLAPGARVATRSRPPAVPAAVRTRLVAAAAAAATEGVTAAVRTKRLLDRRHLRRLRRQRRVGTGRRRAQDARGLPGRASRRAAGRLKAPASGSRGVRVRFVRPCLQKCSAAVSLGHH